MAQSEWDIGVGYSDERGHSYLDFCGEQQNKRIFWCGSSVHGDAFCWVLSMRTTMVTMKGTTWTLKQHQPPKVGTVVCTTCSGKPHLHTGLTASNSSRWGRNLHNSESGLRDKDRGMGVTWIFLIDIKSSPK